MKTSEHIVKDIAKLLPASRRWLERKGYITQDDGVQLTPAGYEYLIKIYRLKTISARRLRTIVK